MTLRCKAECTKIHKKSKSPEFEGIQVGDVIDFSIKIKAVGGGYSGTHAAYITCHNLRTNMVSRLSFNQIVHTLDRFEFKEL